MTARSVGRGRRTKETRASFRNAPNSRTTTGAWIVKLWVFLFLGFTGRNMDGVGPGEMSDKGTEAKEKPSFLIVTGAFKWENL